MRQELIMDALNYLDDDILEETDALRKEGRPLKAVWWKWASLAACLALMISGALVFRFNGWGHGEGPIPPVAFKEKDISEHEPPSVSATPNDGRVTEPPTENVDKSPDPTNEPIASEKPSGGEVDGLPILAVMDFSDMGAGYGAVQAYDVSELVNGNPWNETDVIHTLPVFRNPISIDAGDYFKVTGMNVEKMQETLLDIAGRLGQKADSLKITGPSILSDPSAPVAIESARVIAEGEGVKLEVEASLMVQIDFDPPLEFPKGYNNFFYASYEEKATLGEFLQETYNSLSGWENPVYAVTGGEYVDYEHQSYDVECYNGEGSLTERILNYNFHRIVFYSADKKEQMRTIRIFQTDISQKLGDYPIITVAEARELLLDGEYVTSVPYEVPGGEYVASVELVYNTGEMDEYFMPYYCFYVELPEQANNTATENGPKEYGIYYVPAVEGRYLDDKPLWHSNF